MSRRENVKRRKLKSNKLRQSHRCWLGRSDQKLTYWVCYGGSEAAWPFLDPYWERRERAARGSLGDGGSWCGRQLRARPMMCCSSQQSQGTDPRQSTATNKFVARRFVRSFLPPMLWKCRGSSAKIKVELSGSRLADCRSSKQRSSENGDFEISFGVYIRKRACLHHS